MYKIQYITDACTVQDLLKLENGGGGNKPHVFFPRYDPNPNGFFGKNKFLFILYPKFVMFSVILPKSFWNTPVFVYGSLWVYIYSEMCKRQCFQDRGLKFHTVLLMYSVLQKSWHYKTFVIDFYFDIYIIVSTKAF